MSTNYKWTARLSMLTPFLIVFSFLTMAGGHGSYTPAFVLFPFAAINITWEDQFSIPFLVAGLFQFPAYGFVADKTRHWPWRNRVLTGVFLVHSLLVVLILWLDNPHWR